MKDLVQRPTASEGIGRLQDMTDTLSAKVALIKPVPTVPTDEMVEAGAQALVAWEDGAVWPASWGSDAQRHRKDAARTFMAMMNACPTFSDNQVDDRFDALRRLAYRTLMLAFGPDSQTTPEVRESCAALCIELKIATPDEANDWLASIWNSGPTASATKGES